MTIGVAIALAVAAAATLVAGVRFAFRGRRPVVKLLAAPLVLAVGQWVVLPAAGVVLATVSVRHPVDRAATLGIPGARDVVFRASDGVRLTGWRAPGRNGAAVVLAHGSHGDRADTLDHLRMLSSAGYAVLAYDARGHGRSAGRTNALGWDGAAEMMRLVAGLSGEREPVSLNDAVRRIRVPVLLIASDRTGEHRFDAALRRRIGRRAALWFVADARHTQALQRHPRSYAARVLGLLGAVVGAARRPAA